MRNYCIKARKACGGEASARAHVQMRRHKSQLCVFGVEKVVNADVRFSLHDLSERLILLPLHPQKKTRRQIYVQASRTALGSGLAAHITSPLQIYGSLTCI